MVPATPLPPDALPPAQPGGGGVAGPAGGRGAGGAAAAPPGAALPAGPALGPAAVGAPSTVVALLAGGWGSESAARNGNTTPTSWSSSSDATGRSPSTWTSCKASAALTSSEPVWDALSEPAVIDLPAPSIGGAISLGTRRSSSPSAEGNPTCRWEYPNQTTKGPAER